ncbi:hypothetical protein PMAYCL1PPCAC_09266, partial [Pristionchus mayeri]
SGVVLMFMNIIVCSLIMFDNDPRGKSYRKYIISLQISSMLMDVVLDAYVPILLINCRVIFSDSILAEYLDIVALISKIMTHSQILVVFFFCEAITCYFYCVFYRRA